MQKYAKINAGDKVVDALLALNDTHETLVSQNSGTAFPTTNLVAGMTCFRTDLNKTYTLKTASPAAWVLTEDLSADIYNAETLGGKAPSAYAAASHGNHVPATGTADNATFLRNDNTFQKVTPANIGAAPTNHTHDGSQISGTVANAAAVGGLAVNTSGVNNVANQVARTNGSGYLMCGWINTPSGDVGTGATGSFFVETGSDGYIRKKTLANVRSEILSGHVTYGTTALTPGSSTLATGNIYVQYE